MDYKEIKKLIDDMGESKLDSLDIEFPDGIKISMTKNTNKPMAQTNIIEASAPISVPVIQNKQEQSLSVTQNKETIKYENDNCKYVKSPMVGTFYASSSPEKPEFVKVGDRVKKGQVVCIVEAMKLMNEIESEFDGEIVEVCVKNEDIVEYGMPLFKIK